MRDAEPRSAGAPPPPPPPPTVKPQQPRLGERRGTFLPLLFPFKMKNCQFSPSVRIFDAGSIKATLSRSLFSSEEVSHGASLARSVWLPVTPRRVSVKKAPSFPGAPYVGIIICLNMRGAPAALHFVFPLSGFVTASRAATPVF